MNKMYYNQLVSDIETLLDHLTRNDIYVSKKLFLHVTIISPNLLGNINIHVKDEFIGYLNELQKINSYLYKTFRKKDSFEEIITKFESLQEILRTIILYKEFNFQEPSKNKKFIADDKVIYFLDNQFRFIKDIISDLCNDLYDNISKQRNLLESAKGEVKKNIKGTTELNQVSDLQKSRLDKQIEQFEELQRILVKV